ncbi:hypothetical protein [Pyrodictium abyssi]|uniref:Orc1-like AAA ATPase domain-containing protein n=1 Tax=Pyrodictium abyssi TaxID=54256 RepID=A0ABN6ZR42_9CREN|nr:hypothetical protein PABY_14210 [Pyrodictium abyssi]
MPPETGQARPRCGPPPSRLPSLTGTDARLLDEYLPPLPSRQRVYQQVVEALNEMEKSQDPVLVLLVAEWGEGKTSIYNARVKPWLEERGWRSLEARAATVMAHLASLRGRSERDPAYRLMAALLAAGLEQEGLLARHGAPDAAGSLREYVERVLRSLVPQGGRLVVFIDELEDLVASAREEELAELVAGLVGILNGDVEAVSAQCRGEGCMPGSFHIVASLTPPAYSRLMGLRDFATVAARLRRRIRSIWIQPLPRREAFAFLESLARYTLGRGLDALLEDHSLAHAVVSGTLGNMGALVSAFRYLVSWARGRGGCGDGVAVLSTSEVLEALQGLTLSVGGAELPALNSEAYARLAEGWEARAKLAGFDTAVARRLLDELVARGTVPVEELAVAVGARPGVVAEMVQELNVYGEQSWPRRELGVQRLVHEVVEAPAVEDAFKLLRAVEPEAVKLLPQLAGREEQRPLEQLLDTLVYLDSAGRLVVAVPADERSAADLVADASPLELSRAEAERLAALLWEAIFSRLLGSGGARAYMLSPRLQRLLYVSPELSYLDFIADRVERLQVIRRVYTEASRGHLAAGISALLAAEGLLAEPPALQGEGVARAELSLQGGARARVLVYTVPGEVTAAEARRLESQVMAALMSGWRPHAVLLVHHGGVEPQAQRLLDTLEGKLFLKVVDAPIESMVSRARLQALGVKLADEAGGVEEALRAAVEVARNPATAEGMGFDPLRLHSLLRELAEEIRPRERLERALEEGVDGAPLVIRDPRLGYDVERPTELSGALRYFLVVPSTRASAREALHAAYEYVMRYHLYRGPGGEGRGLLSPDIDRGEAQTLEKYMLLLAANGFLDKTNGTVRIDTLSPMERSVLRALEQLGARSQEVPASRVWELLVMEARNPGTRRMLLQALVHRGLVSAAASRRVDPERSRLRLRDGEEAAWQLIREARSLLREVEEDPEARAWGLVVSAKARDYRAGSLEEFARKMSSLLDTAEEALKAGNVLMALRLARTVLDTVEYVRDEVLRGHVKPAAAEARRLRGLLEEYAERIEEARHAAEKMLEQLTGRPVKLRVEGLERLQEAVRAIEEVEELRLSEKQLEEEVQRLWEEARRRYPRDPGRHLPFYVGGSGPALHFNYKLWLIARRLEELGLARLGESGLEEGDWLRRTIQALEALASEARRLLEESAGLRRRAERLAERLRRLGVEAPAPQSIVLQGLSAPEELGLDEAEQLLQEARRQLEEGRRPLLELEEQVDRLLGELEQLEELAAEAESWIHGLEEAARHAREAGLPVGQRLREALEDLALALDQAQAMKGKARAVLQQPGRLLDALRDARSLVESALTLLRDSLERSKRIHAEAVAEAERQRQALEAEAQALREALERARAGAPQPPRSSDPFAAVAGLHEYMEKLRRMAAEAGVLSQTELEAYKVVALERRRRGELLLREAAELVAERLGIGPEEARRILISLIEKEVLEPRL